MKKQKIGGTVMEEKKGILDWYFKSNLLARILIGFVLGILAGLIFKDGVMWLKPFGAVFVNLLKMIVMPVIISTLIIGAASISPAKLGKVGIKIVLFYLLTSAFAVALGLLMANLFKPGLGLDLGNFASVGARTVNSQSLSQTIIGIIPKNPFASITAGKILPTIFFSILFGIAMSYLRESKDVRIKNAGNLLYSIFDGAAESMYLIVNWILQYAPIGVFALISVVFATQGADALGALGVTTLASFSGYILHAFIVYGVILMIFKIGPKLFFSKAKEPIFTAFVTRSSSGTLPVTMKTAEDKMGIHKNIYSFTLPLGATINMDGTAIYQGVCVLFIANAIGAPLSFGGQITVVVTAVLASIGTAGVPGAGAIMLFLVLESVGMPVEAGTPVAAAYAMILGIDAILDMGRTAVNVSGDLVGTTIVAKSEGLLDMSKWKK